MCTSKLSGKPDEMLEVTCDGLASHPGVATLLVASCYGNRDKLLGYGYAPGDYQNNCIFFNFICFFFKNIKKSRDGHFGN